MPARSKKQQRFMGMVHAAQKGKKPASKEVAKVAKTMDKADVEDFASTEHEGLPEKVKTEDLAPVDFGDDAYEEKPFEQKLREFIRTAIKEVLDESFDNYANYNEPPIEGGDEDELDEAIPAVNTGLTLKKKQLQDKRKALGQKKPTTPEERDKKRKETDNIQQQTNKVAIDTAKAKAEADNRKRIQRQQSTAKK